MTESVVHGLEVVDVHEQDGDRIRSTFGLTQSEVEAVEEQRPIREPGQRVVQSLIGEVGFGLLAVGDVQHRPDDAWSRSPSSIVRACTRTWTQRTVPSGHISRCSRSDRRTRLDIGPHRRPDREPVVGMNRVDERLHGEV